MLKDCNLELEVLDEGVSDAEALIFLHGWPDDSSMWDEQVAHFRSLYRCLRIDLPGFGEKKYSYGFDFEEVTEAIDRAIEKVEPKIRKPFTLVTHDWGAVYGYLYQQTHPQKVRKIAAIDVGTEVSQQENILGYFLIPGYQLTLATAFKMSQVPLVGESLGNVMTLVVETIFGLMNEPGKVAGPSRRTHFTATQNYPYYYFWKNMFFGRSKIRMRTPQIPLFYAYGDAGIKRFMMFQTKRWLNRLMNKEGSVVMRMNGAGHWLMKDQPVEYNKALEAFLQQE